MMTNYSRLFFMSLVLLATQFLFHTKGKAQFTYDWINNIPVSDGQKKYDLAWAGGLNAVQTNTMDLDGDGNEDLVLFERTSGGLKTFLFSQNSYQFAPEYLSYFPPVWGWILLRDFNQDGKKDIFTSHPLGIKVFINTQTGSGPPSWRPFNNGNALLSSGPAGPLNVALTEDDLPDISDVDGDGDLDILGFGFYANTVDFHENISPSNDTLVFVKTSDRWGDFEDCQCGDFVFYLNYPCPPTGGRTEHANARSLMSFDMDGDGDRELAVSEMECTEVYLLENVSSDISPQMRNPGVLFEGSQPAQMYKYPVAYHEDVDNDGDSDLIVSPNTRKNIGWVMDFNHSVWLYENTGSDQTPSYIFRERDFLQKNMLEFGDDAVPAFYDLDNDGDLDMIVGSMDRRTAGLRYFENDGDALSPSFILRDIDFLKLSEHSLFNIKPQFIDLNNDHTIDIAFTATSNNDFKTSAYYILNNSFWGFDPVTSAPVITNVQTGLNEYAAFYDISGDGMADILVGKDAGNMEYYRNSNMDFSGNFALETDAYYNIVRDPLHANLVPEIGDTDNNGLPDLILSDNVNTIYIYRDFLSVSYLNNVAEEIEVYTKDMPLDSSVVTGTNLRPVVVNLYNEDLPMIVVGTGQGGLLLLRNRDAVQSPKVNKLEVFANPNPSNENKINIRSNRNAVFDIYTVTGQQVAGLSRIRTGTLYSYPTYGLNPGMYLIRVFYDYDQYEVVKFVVN